jgi:hypothetical protein
MNLPPPPPDVRRGNNRPSAASLGTPADFRGGLRGLQPAAPVNPTNGGSVPAAAPADDTPPPSGPRKQAATETIAARAGALSDEIAFPEFVAGLVHGTFDAVVDSAIRQMESYASLVSAVAKPVEEFTRENVSENQAKDYLVQQYPKDLYLSLEGVPTVLPRPSDDKDNPDAARSPEWLASFNVGGQELTAELIQDTLIPEAQKRLGRSRQQMLATMVLLGLNRVVVKDGTISARLRFRAEASDQAKVDYAVSDDPGGDASWGARGSLTYPSASTKVSTVGVTAQSDANLKAELFGEVKINFASETLPLEKFADDARRTLLERHARPLAQAAGPKASAQPSAQLAPAEPVVAAAPAASAPAPAPAPTPAGAARTPRG